MGDVWCVCAGGGSGVWWVWVAFSFAMSLRPPREETHVVTGRASSALVPKAHLFDTLVTADCWRTRRPTPHPVGLNALRLGPVHVGCSGDGARPRRSTRSQPSEASFAPSSTRTLAAVETDAEGRIVYVDLRAAAQGGRFGALVASLMAIQPTERMLERLTPINRGRILMEIDDAATLACFTAWLRAAVASDAAVEPGALRRLLEPLGPRLRLVGAQWIVPKATEYEPRVVLPPGAAPRHHPRGFI